MTNDDIGTFLKENATICTDCGMEDPEKMGKGITIQPGKTSFAALYKDMYDKYDFPMKSLYQNRCIKHCPKGTTDVAGVCTPCDGAVSHCEWCRNTPKKCTKCLQNQPFKYLKGV